MYYSSALYHVLDYCLHSWHYIIDSDEEEDDKDDADEEEGEGDDDKPKKEVFK